MLLDRLGHHDKALLDAAAECIIARGEACTSNSSGGSSVGDSSERDSSGEIDAMAAAAAAAEAQPSRAAGMAAAVQAWCFARCKYNMPRLYDALGASILQHLACVPPYNLAQLLWAFASQGCRHRPLLAAAARLVTTRLLRVEAVRSRRRAGSLASDSSNSGGSASLLDYDYADRSSMQEAQREQQALQQSDSGTRSSGPAMPQSVQTQQQDAAKRDGREPHFDSQGVANTLWAFSKAGHRCPQLMQRIGDELAGSYTLATVAGASSTPASSSASDGATHRHLDSAQTLPGQGHFAAPPSLGVSGLLGADMSHASSAGSTGRLKGEASSAARASHAAESAGAAYREVVEFGSSSADLQCSSPGELFDASVPLLGPAPSPPCDDPAEQAQAPESDTGAGGHRSGEAAASQALPAGPMFGSLAYGLGDPALDPRLNPEINMEAMHPADLCLIAWAFAKLRFPHPALFSALLRAALRDAPRYNLKGWSQLVWAYSTLGLPEEELLMSRLQQLQLQQERQQSEAQASGQQHQHQQRRGFQQGQGSGQGFVRGKVMGRHRGRAGAQRPRRQWATGAGRRDGGEGGGSSSGGSSDGARPNRRPGLWSRSTDMNGSGSGRSNAGGGNSSFGGGSNNAGSGGRDRERDAHGSLTQGPEGGAGAAITDPLSSCSCLVQPGVGGVHFAQARSVLAPVGSEPGHTAAAAAGNSEGLTVLSEGAGRLQSLRVASPTLLVPPVARDWLHEASAFGSSIGSSGPSSSGSSNSARRVIQPGASALAAVQASLADAEGDAYGDAEADAMLATQQHAVLRPGLSGRAGSGNGSGRQSRRAVQTWAQRPQATTSAAEHRLHVSQSSAELLPRPNRPPPTHAGRAELGAVIQHTAAAAAVVGHAWDEGTLQAVPASVIVMAGIAPQAL